MIEVVAVPEGGRPGDLWFAKKKQTLLFIISNLHHWSRWKLVMCLQIAVYTSATKGLLSVISLVTVVGAKQKSLPKDC